MSAHFKDLFSRQSKDYALYRPDYPRALFATLAEAAPGETVWDCATGNGQAAVALAQWFPRIFATDAAPAQLANATPADNVTYQLGTAEDSGLADRSIDLITVAQAFHWFDHQAFYREAERVAKPGAIAAIWCYANHTVNPDIDRVVRHVYDGILYDYWQPERYQVEAGYQDIIVPWRLEKMIKMEIVQSWNCDDFLGYLYTWSATNAYIQANGEDPIAKFTAQIRSAWGAGNRTIRWPMPLRIFRLPDNG